MTGIDLDDASRRILAALQADGRRTLQDVAERAGLSPTPCWRRMKAMEEAGIIRRYVATLDREKLGLGLCVFAHVTLQRNATNTAANFEQAMRDCPEVLECYAVTGDADYIIKVVASDPKDYQAFLEAKIFRTPFIAQIRSSIALKEVKDETALPL
jgi:Lrp/AsnC family leucine-responsive transcriptional regulator